MSELILDINGARYGGWREVSAHASIEALARSVTVSVTDVWAGNDKPWPINPGDSIQALCDDDDVLNGYVDAAQFSFDAKAREISLVARDACADLVDCSVIAPFEFKNITLTNLAKKLCAPFGVAVKVTGDAGVPFPVFNIDPSETAFDALERACRQRGLLAMPDYAGGIEIAAPATLRCADRLIQGQNILRASGTLDQSQRYRDYKVVSQAYGDDNFSGPAAAQVAAAAADNEIARYRPLIVHSEMGADTSIAKKRAQWEAAVRAARGKKAQITVVGWRQSNGDLWRVNRIVYVQSSWLRIDGDMLISSVELKRDQSGEKAILEVTGKGAYDPQPAIAVGTGSNAIWNILSEDD